jgi:hypothetical protein
MGANSDFFMSVCPEHKPDPPGHFHAKTMIGPEWFQRQNSTLVIHFCRAYWLEFFA